MKNTLLIFAIILITISCGSESDDNDPMMPAAKPSIGSFTPSMGIEGDTVTIRLSDYENEVISSISFGSNEATWFEIEDSDIRTVVPDDIIRGENVLITVEIDGETTTSSQLFQVINPMFISLDKPLFALEDTITISGSNLNLDKSKYDVSFTDGINSMIMEVVNVESNAMQVVRTQYPGESFFYIPLKAEIEFNGIAYVIDDESTLTRSFTISDRFNTLSNSPGSLFYINIFPQGPIQQKIMLGEDELTSTFSISSDDNQSRQYLYSTSALSNIGETLKVSIKEGEIPFLLRESGRDTILIQEGTYDFSPKEVINDFTAEITLEVSHVYSPPDYKVIIMNQATGEELELISLRQTTVEQNRMVLTGTASINERGVYLVKFSVRDDEYILTPENGSELVFRED